MQRGIDGSEISVDEIPDVKSKAITQLCLNPASTRKRAGAGRPTPCYRCTAARDTPSGCFFLDHPKAVRIPAK